MAVRLEKVIVDLEDRFTGPAARIAAAATLIRQELDGTAGSAKGATRELGGLEKQQTRVGASSDASGRQLDRYSGRLRIIADLVGILGPGLIPIGAVGVPAVTGLAGALGFVVTAGAGVIASLQRVGDALKTVNEARLEPTTENLAKARAAMEHLSPATQDLVRQLGSLRGEWRELRNAGAEQLSGGLGEALDHLVERGPDAERVLERIGYTVGQIAADGAESLASDRWDDFFEFLAVDAPPALASLASSVGSLGHGMAELWMAFDPLNDDFLGWLEDATARFDRWSEGLAETQGFEDFVAYLRENGPQVAETLGAVGNAFLQIVEAAAPLGGPVLHALELTADALAKIADSGAGPALMATWTALSVLSRGQAAFGRISETSWAQAYKGADTFGGKVTALRTPLLRGGAALAGIGIAASGAADGLGLTNTASGALLGMMGGPWGAAVGGAIGLVLDLAEANKEAAPNVAELTATYDAQTGAITENTRAKAVQRAQTEGLLDDAAELGVAESTVVDALLGDAAAHDVLTAAITANSDARGMSLTSAEDLRKTYSEAEVQTILLAQAAYRLEHGIPGVAGEFKLAASDAKQFAAGMGGVKDSTDDATNAQERFQRAVSRTSRLLSDRASWRDYQQSLDDATAALKENGRNLDTNTQKGRDNEAALDSIADTAVKYAETLKRADRGEFLANARRDFVDTAVKMGMARGRAQELAERLLTLDKIKARPEVNVDTSRALSGINALEARLRAIKDEDVFVNVRRIGATTMGPRPGIADGATIPKTPGGYYDYFPALLAGGEEVVSNRRGQADRFRPLLKRINALAEGGTVGWPGWPAPGGSGLGPLIRYDDPRDKRGDRSLEEFHRDEVRQMREIRRAVAQVFRQFAVDLSTGPQSVRQGLRAFKRDVEQAGGVWTKGLERNAEKIRTASERYEVLNGRLEAQQQAVDAANSALESLKSAQSQHASAVSGQFRTGLFGGGLSGLDKALTGDIANRSAKDRLLEQLRGMGLDPTSAFYKELAAESDVKTLQQLAAGGSGAVAHYAAQYDQREALNAAAGDREGLLSYGQAVQAAAVEAAAQTLIQQGLLDQQRELQKDVNKGLQELKDATKVDGPKKTGEEVGKAINGTFEHAWQKGSGK